MLRGFLFNADYRGGTTMGESLNPHPVKAAENSREKTIVKTSIVGIIANVFLAAFKAVIGLMTNSIAIVLDAVNNISDAGSSLITIVGTKLAGREPDKKHPFGYGRIEYLSAMVISVIVLYAGITSFVESVKQIIHPETPDYNTVSLIIVAVAVVVKILLGRYVKGVGEKVNSDSLINSGKDAMLDSIISASTLAAAGIFLIFHVSLEAWLGAVISLVIIKSGVGMLRDTISQILGERNDMELVKGIKETVMDFPDVQGAYDLVLNNYGPDTWNGSIHIEVPDTYSADQLDQLIREITMKVLAEHHVILTAIGVYSVNTKDENVIRIRRRVQDIVLANEYVRQMHGFYLLEDQKTMRFDVVVSLDAKDRKAVYREVKESVQKEFPDYKLQVAMDTDFAEE
uniref:Cation diffusion facilitator family transporter n=1 Tax=uncultured bacterium Contig2 TaxID=1393529 RepID=W0FPQ1_9BACT|nr:cation diffusion facilitator family transporter [uncultured bacterium Contig2]